MFASLESQFGTTVAYMNQKKRLDLFWVKKHANA